MSASVCIVCPRRATESFIRAHINRLPRVIGVIEDSGGRPELNERPLLPDTRLHKLGRHIRHRMLSADPLERAYRHAFEMLKPDVILAEYGYMGYRIREACVKAGIPLVVHFHGGDCFKLATLKEHNHYDTLLPNADIIVAVSQSMRSHLIQMGAPEERMRTVSCGVDCSVFQGADSGKSPPIFLATGRMVEKKGPHLTLIAFAKLVSRSPQARLRMIGDGPLLNVCQDLARAMNIGDKVAFLGAVDHAEVRQEMRRARAFVQHSVIAGNGDREGMPVAVVEASASGLPVIATKHEGILEAVREGVTGFLVDEFDTDAMAERMKRLAESPTLAASLGAEGRRDISARYDFSRSIKLLQDALDDAAENRRVNSSL